MVYYSKNHVRSVIDALNIEIVNDTDKRFNCLCPFHGNTDTPAFSISKEEGLWICFNESCAQRGTLEHLVMQHTGRTSMEALRFIANRNPASNEDSLSDLLGDAFAPEPEWPQFPQMAVNEMVSMFWEHPEAIEYMESRGFTDEVLREFEVGYSPREGGQVVYPVHNPNGSLCVGVVGRGIEYKFFDNSKGLPRKKVLFNLHNARKKSKSVIVVESGFDVMRIHQAGFPNTVATLGSSVSDGQLELMERNFTEIIVFSDNDEAGMSMRRKVQMKIKGAAVLHAATDYDTLYPSEGIKTGVPKDAGDLRIEQIKQMLNNPLTSYDVGLA